MILLDCGATHSFLSSNWADRAGIAISSLSRPLNVLMADGTSQSLSCMGTGNLKVDIDKCSFQHSFSLLQLGSVDAVLGKPWFFDVMPTINFRQNEVTFDRGSFIADELGSQERSPDPRVATATFHFISAKRALKDLRSGCHGFLAWLEQADVEEPVAESALPKIHVSGSQKDQLKVVLSELQDRFPKKLPRKLPPLREINHAIDLEPGSSPPSRPAYRLSKPELMEFQRQLDELLAQGYVQPSKSPFGAPVFFIKKKDGSFRLVCDWRQLNKITIKNRACMPNIDDLFDVVQGSKFFSKLDLASGYYQVRICPEDVSKTAVNTPLGHFEFNVMGFGLTNAPATFTALMNNVLKPFLRKSVVVFLDDILIFSRTWEDHIRHIREVLTALKSHNLFCKAKKCEFATKCVTFLGHQITGTSLAPDEEKLVAVKDWPEPKSVPEVRRFLGFSNYFRRFIDHYASIARPLEEITGRYTKFEWNNQRRDAFKQLKQCLLSAPVLRLADDSKLFRVVTDASDIAVAGVLLQEARPKEWHPVAYTSRRLTSAEQNYHAQERETLAVMHALKVWKLYLYKPFEIVMDNMGVTYLKCKKNLSKREARWMEFLSDFEFTTVHRPGSQNVADSLSRRPDMELCELETSWKLSEEEQLDVRSLMQKDREVKYIRKRLNSSPSDAFHKRYKWEDSTGLLFLRTLSSPRLYIPKGCWRLRLLKEFHDCAVAGHPGRERTYSRIARRFYWPGLSIDVKRFVRSCDSCQRMKSGRNTQGLLQPLPVPVRPWEDISMDLIVGLPVTCDGEDAVCTFVDRLTKCVHLIPTRVTADAKQIARLYVDNVFKLHGLSNTIVCDRDPRFTAEFFKHVFSLLGTEIKFSTANHPQIDGQTERVHRVIGDILRSFVNHRQNDWNIYLPLCEFAINDMKHTSTQHSPFFLNYGWHPRSPADSVNPVRVSSSSHDTNSWLADQQEALKTARDCIIASQARQALYADQGRQDITFDEGEEILVHRDFLSTDISRSQPCNKLRPVWLGPFPIIKKLSSTAYRVKLPTNSRAHPVLNITAMKKYYANDIPGRIQPPPPPVTDLDGFTRYSVERVISVRFRRGKRQFLVKWTGYRDPTWEPEDNLKDEEGQHIVQLQQFLKE